MKKLSIFIIAILLCITGCKPIDKTIHGTLDEPALTQKDSSIIETTTTEDTSQVAPSTLIPETMFREGIQYVLNTNSMMFHYPTCGSGGLISAKNKAYYYGTREELIEKGYSPCGNCHP